MFLVFIGFCLITSAYGNCKDGWTEYKNKCYKGFIADPRPWRAARDSCRSKSADLASIHSHKEHTFLVKMINNENPGFEQERVKDYLRCSYPRLVKIALKQRHGKGEQSQLVVFEQGTFYNQVCIYLSKSKINKSTARSMSFTWTGLNDIAAEGDFIWSDGTSLDYLNWAFRQPNDFKPSQDCVSIIPEGKFRWGDFSCSNTYDYICAYDKEGENRKPILKGGCKKGWMKYKNKCFKGFYHPRKSWRAARASCRSRSADLASIHNAKEHKFLVKLINPVFWSFYWIGLNDIKVEEDFVWSDGTPTDYTNWGKGQPNNFKSRQHCVGIIPAGRRRWGDFSCSQKFKYVCAYGLGPTNLTTTSSLQTSTTPATPRLTYTTSTYTTETTSSTSTEGYCSWELKCITRNRKKRSIETFDGLKKVIRNGGIYLVP